MGPWHRVSAWRALFPLLLLSTQAWAQIAAPSNTWISRPVPAFPGSIDRTAKHVHWAYDSDRGVFYAWGGDYCINDPVYGPRCASHELFWQYDVGLDRWDLLLNQAAANQAGYPQGRCLAGLAYDPRRKVVWMTSGQYRFDNYYPGLLAGGLWAFNPASRKWSKEGPSAENGESQHVNVLLDMTEYIAYDPVNDELFAPSRTNVRYMLSGVTVGDGVQNDNWRTASFSAESPVFGTVAFAVDTKRNRTIVYDPYRGETWSFDFATKQTKRLSTQALPAKSVFGMDYDSANDAVVFFAGYSDYEGLTTAAPLNQLWVLNLTSNQWSQFNAGGSVPSPRKGESLIYDVRNNVHVIMGGTGGFAEDSSDRIYLLRLNLGQTPDPTPSAPSNLQAQ